MIGEPLPIELANTSYAVRGRRLEGLPGSQQLAAWLRDVRHLVATPLLDADLLAVSEADLTTARALRDSIRALAQAAVDDEAPPQGALAAINTCVRSGPRWRELRWEAAPSAATHSSAPPVAAVLGEIAEATVDLFAGRALADLRACQGPGCVLFFVKNHPRREWCSPGCGNRARAARHYERTRHR